MVHGPQDPSLKSVQAPGSTTRMLEAQVAERTSELRAANEHLEVVNAQLIAEINQRQRLEAAGRIRSQEMAVADEVARILTSTLHPDQVYDGFGNEVKKLVDYDWFSIRLIDHDAECYTLRNRSGTENPSRQVGAVVPLKGTQTGKMIETQESIIRFDFKDDARFPGDQIFLMEGFRSSALIPLISKGRVIGSMHLRSRGVNTYGEREQAILERLAKQIAPAVENALLYEQTVQDQEERAVADKVAQIITSTLDIEEVCEEFTRAMKSLVEIDQASINIINQGTATYKKNTYLDNPGLSKKSAWCCLWPTRGPNTFLKPGKL